MTPRDATARLERRLVEHARRAGVAVTIVSHASTRWASVTFVGARHRVGMRLARSEAAYGWIAGLPEAELPLPGHLVADLVLVERSDEADQIDATIEVLTVEDG